MNQLIWVLYHDMPGQILIWPAWLCGPVISESIEGNRHELLIASNPGHPAPR